MLITKVGPLVALNDALRDAHESAAESVRAEIEKRRAKGIPLDDATPFANVSSVLQDAIGDCAAMDGAALREHVAAALAMCSGGLKELDPFEPNPEYEGIKIAVRSVTERFRIETHEAVAEAKTSAERFGVFASYVQAALAEIVGLEDENGPVEMKGPLSDEQIETLDDLGLIADLWSACRHFANLPASKKKRFGSQAPSASATSTAPSAASRPEGASDATAAPVGGNIASQTMTPTPAPAGT